MVCVVYLCSGDVDVYVFVCLTNVVQVVLFNYVGTCVVAFIIYV